MRYQTLKFLSSLIGETSVAMTLPGRFGTRSSADPATRWLSPRQWKLVWSWNTAKKQSSFPRRCFLTVIIWQRGAKAVGLISTLILRRTGTWLVRAVHLIKRKRLAQHALSTRTANLSQGSKGLTTLVVPTDRHLRGTWWKKSWEMEPLTPSSKLQMSLPRILEVSWLRVAWGHCEKKLLWKAQPLISQTKLSRRPVKLGQK